VKKAKNKNHLKNEGIFIKLDFVGVHQAPAQGSIGILDSIFRRGE
jgi:hypothetical protein